MTTFREHLIASALQGLCANSGFDFVNCTKEDVAKLAISLADAVMEEDSISHMQLVQRVQRELAELDIVADLEVVARALRKAKAP